jgi:hypothetical protein
MMTYYKRRLRRRFLVPNTSASLQTTLAADAHLAEGQFLHEEQTLNNAKQNNNNNNSIRRNLVTAVYFRMALQVHIEMWNKLLVCISLGLPLQEQLMTHDLHKYEAPETASAASTNKNICYNIMGQRELCGTSIGHFAVEDNLFHRERSCSCTTIILAYKHRLITNDDMWHLSVLPIILY